MKATHRTLRHSAIRRGLAFIYNNACKPENFFDYGSDYLCCFCCVASTSRDSDLRQLARVLGRDLARKWLREHASVPSNANAEDIADLVFGYDAAVRLGLRDEGFKKQLKAASSNFQSRDFLFFDPTVEPPPFDLPLECDCGTQNRRASAICVKCDEPLTMQSVYWVWFVALTRSYTGERLGVRLGARFADVLKWLPKMRPYPQPCNRRNDWDFYWSIYAVTHVVYTLNDFSAYQLSPKWLPAEFGFLKRSISQTIKMGDPEATGEILDSLKSFGLSERHPLIREGMNYLLWAQNEDGSWGDPRSSDAYDQYHPTWTAIDGLREYRWRGVRLSLQRLKPLVGCSIESRHNPDRSR